MIIQPFIHRVSHQSHQFLLRQRIAGLGSSYQRYTDHISDKPVGAINSCDEYIKLVAVSIQDEGNLIGMRVTAMPPSWPWIPASLIFGIEKISHLIPVDGSYFIPDLFPDKAITCRGVALDPRSIERGGTSLGNEFVEIAGHSVQVHSGTGSQCP